MIIKDRLIEPYFIKVSDSSFDLFKGSVSEKGNYVEYSYGYYSKLSSCLLKVSKLKTLESEEEMTISQYLDKLEKVTKEITETIKV